MYFWKLESLKEDLIGCSISEKERLLYLLWLGGVTIAAEALAVFERNVWDHIDFVVMFVGFIFGTLYLYRRNEGASGRDFLTRYVALNWVFGIRFAVLVVVPATVVGLMVDSLFLGGVPEHSTPFESSVLVLLQVGYYVRLGQHLSAVASARVAA